MAEQGIGYQTYQAYRKPKGGLTKEGKQAIEALFQAAVRKREENMRAAADAASQRIDESETTRGFLPAPSAGRTGPLTKRLAAGRRVTKINSSTAVIR